MIIWKPNDLSTRTKNVVNVVHTGITPNHCCNQKILSREMNLAPRIVLHVLREDVDLRAYKRYIRHLLDVCLRCLRLERSKKLLLFAVKICSKKSCLRMRKCLPKNKNLKSRTMCMLVHHTNQGKSSQNSKRSPSISVVVWWGVLWNGATAIHFCARGLKNYRKNP